jgi:hypothetical protein
MEWIYCDRTLVLVGPDASGQLLERAAVEEGRPDTQVPVYVANGAIKLIKDQTLLHNVTGLTVGCVRSCTERVQRAFSMI